MPCATTKKPNYVLLKYRRRRYDGTSIFTRLYTWRLSGVYNRRGSHVFIRGGDIMCGLCFDQDEYDTRHGLSRREKLQRDPAYGDWLLEQEKDRKMGEGDD